MVSQRWLDCFRSKKRGRPHKFQSGPFSGVFAWFRNLFTFAGLVHTAAVLCFGVQAVFLNIFLVTYISYSALTTLIVEVPLFFHLIWYWRPESAQRATPTQWFCYSWLHAAKVVVLFCRVMPQLTSTTSGVAAIQGRDFSFDTANFMNFFSPNVLVTLLLVTPAFYALLMLRTGKASFGSSSTAKRVTVDVIMRYDMLWHVVIDMVDQVDMFYYSRIAEWVGTQMLETHRQSLILVQTVVVACLFLTMVMQAQAFPGVILDRWPDPDFVVLPDGLIESDGPRYRVKEDEATVTSARAANTATAVCRRALARWCPGPAAVDKGQGDDLHRCRQKQEIMLLIRQQNVIIARKRSACASYLVDFSFFVIRFWLFTSLVSSNRSEEYFPGLGIKNFICFFLNLTQNVVLVKAGSDYRQKIESKMAEYIMEFRLLSPYKSHLLGTPTTPHQSSPSYDRKQIADAKNLWKVRSVRGAIRQAKEEKLNPCYYLLVLLLFFVATFVLTKGSFLQHLTEKGITAL
eukprot:TRINITY_DN106549_c0_g1_i1.p1 TRINITY_DN106549_c0_g1~~TRINITY_DN106549_c0_g1_i1.p1  ORF type:complete len:516 (+),score=79.56 TRINITY_DN106549_c0_g1_i1:133-1680(+)